jgi:UDP-GlcNAc:undecaprenyl-phosphate GlcNAc-1-phosphate transferase
MLGAVFLAFAVSWLVAAWLIGHAKGHTTRYAYDLPQRFHHGDVPRLGGVAMSLGCLLATATLLVVTPDSVWGSGHMKGWQQWLTWWVVLLPMLLGGVSEDITQRLNAVARLALSACSGVLALLLLEVTVPRLDLPLFDVVFVHAPLLGMGLALLAVTGLPHAFNIIDGYNGLAGAVALIASLALAYVAFSVGDLQLTALMLCLAGSTLGILFWNYPRGLIFAGDGGAYFWGGMIALASLLLVQRNEAVSPWFPLLLLAYPVWEAIFSIYRKVARGDSPGLADALHFHQLIYRRLVRGVLDEDHAREMLRRNNRTSPYLWGFSILTVVPAVLFWNNTIALMLFCIAFAITYVWGYIMIVRFKVPRWMKR